MRQPPALQAVTRTLPVPLVDSADPAARWLATAGSGDPARVAPEM